MSLKSIQYRYMKFLDNSLDNGYVSYFIDINGNEVLTLDTFIKIETVKRNLTFLQFCDYIQISAPTLNKLKKQKPNEGIYIKIASILGVDINWLKQLPITNEQLKLMYEEDQRLRVQKGLESDYEIYRKDSFFEQNK